MYMVRSDVVLMNFSRMHYAALKKLLQLMNYYRN